MPITKVVQLSRTHADPAALRAAADILHAGGLVVFPTETVYGLGADAFQAAAVGRVFEAKGRPSDNPLILHIAAIEQLRDAAIEIPDVAETLIERFWPGPLTLVLKAAEIIPDIVTAGLDTVAVRMPDHPVALGLIRALGSGIVGPSANRSGRPSPTLASHVVKDLDGRVEMILDSGPADIGVESTVLDVSEGRIVLLRQGGLAIEQICSLVGRVELSINDDLLRRSPGTRHRHYAPRACVRLIGPGDAAGMSDALHEAAASGSKTGCIVHSLPTDHLSGIFIRRLSPDIHHFARELFAALREMDDQRVGLIVVEAVAESGIGAAVMDRLRRASAG